MSGIMGWVTLFVVDGGSIEARQELALNGVDAAQNGRDVTLDFGKARI